MGTGALKKQKAPGVQVTEALQHEPPELVDDTGAVIPGQYVGVDQEILRAGDIWKLNFAASPEAPDDWLKRMMWLTSTGGLFYYSQQFRRPMGCSLAGMSISAPEGPVLGRYIIELRVEIDGEARPTLLAAETLEERDAWVESIRAVKAAEAGGGAGDALDALDPLEPFLGRVRKSNRGRMSRIETKQASENMKMMLSEGTSSRGSETFALGPGATAKGVAAGGDSFGERIMAHVATLCGSGGGTRMASVGPSIFAPAKPLADGSNLAAKIGPQIRRNSQAGFANRENTVLVFDWDDTIFPTTFVRKDCGLDWRYTVDEQTAPGPVQTQVKELLNKLSERAEALLLLANSLARVVIVTLARSPWVYDSAQRFMPRLYKRITEMGIKVVYARECISHAAKRQYAENPFKTSEDEGNYWMRAKAAAMEGEFRSLLDKDGRSWKNLISIGDSDFERLALQTAAGEHARMEAAGGQVTQVGVTSELVSKDGHLQRLRAKTVKMLEEPSCEELIAQVSLFAMWLQPLVQRDEGLAVELKDSTDNEILNELHKQVTGHPDKLTWLHLADMDEASAQLQG